MAAGYYQPNTVKQDCQEFEASLGYKVEPGYTVRICQTNKQTNKQNKNQRCSIKFCSYSQPCDVVAACLELGKEERWSLPPKASLSRMKDR